MDRQPGCGVMLRSGCSNFCGSACSSTQGDRRDRAPRVGAAESLQVGRGELRGSAGESSGERALRAHQGRVLRRGRDEARALRGCLRRDRVPRRNRGVLAVSSTQEQEVDIRLSPGRGRGRQGRPFPPARPRTPRVRRRDAGERSRGDEAVSISAGGDPRSRTHANRRGARGSATVSPARSTSCVP